MPTTNITSAPGRQMPQIAAAAPVVPRSRSPTRIAMLVALRPGRVWLIESSSTKAVSSSQRCLPTRLLRRYATTPPPKLVAPSRRKTRKISPIETVAGRVGSPLMRGSLVSLGRVALQAIHDAGLGGPERDPVPGHGLQRHEEVLAASLDLGMQLVAAIELGLERVLAHQRLMIAPGAPEGRVGLGLDSLSEIQPAEVEQNLLHDHLVDELEPIGARHLERAQAREQARQAGEGCPVALRHLVHRELRGVGEQEADAAERVLERQRLGLELDLVLPGGVRPHVQVRGGLEIGVAELENDLGLAQREAVLVTDPPAQDEGVVVEPEVRGVQKDHLADLGPLLVEVMR